MISGVLTVGPARADRTPRLRPGAGAGPTASTPLINQAHPVCIQADMLPSFPAAHLSSSQGRAVGAALRASLNVGISPLLGLPGPARL